MKTIQKLPMIDARTVTVLAALAIGLGVAVHEFFFVVALVIGLVAAVAWTAQKGEEYLREFRSFHWYP